MLPVDEQTASSLFDPSQFAPPFDGTGLLQDLDLDFLQELFPSLKMIHFKLIFLLQ